MLDFISGHMLLYTNSKVQQYIVGKYLGFAARKRAVYDQFGEEGLKAGVPSGTIDSGAWTQGYTFHGNADKVFRDFFGGDNPFQGKSV